MIHHNENDNQIFCDTKHTKSKGEKICHCQCFSGDCSRTVVEFINFKVYLTYTCKARNIGYADNIDRTLRTQLNKQEPKAFVANWHRTSAFDCNTGFSFD